MKRIAILAVAALSLASCTTTGTSKVDVALQKNLPKVCDALDTAHIAFSAVAATGKVKASTVAKEQAAYQGVAILCDDPSRATLATSIIKVTQAVMTITSALKEAKAVSNG
jgi:hypothetical protein